MSAFAPGSRKSAMRPGGLAALARDVDAIARRRMPGWPAVRAPVATVILIRHADYIAGADTNPSLSAAGQARAQELRHVLANTGLQTIFVTSYARTQQTAAPLAATLGLSTTPIALTPATAETHVDVLESAIRGLPRSSTALVVGHSNTVPLVIKRLGGPDNVLIESTEFDRLFVLCCARLTRLRYGAAA